MINEHLKKSVESFLLKAKTSGIEGKLISKKDFNELNIKLNGIIPNWFIELFSSYSLAGIGFDFQAYEPEEDFDGLMPFEFADSVNIFNETEECSPGCYIQEIGYFCIGTDPSGGGNPFFINKKDLDNPKIYQVYHDVSNDANEIENEGMEIVGQSLSEFLDKAIFN